MTGKCLVGTHSAPYPAAEPISARQPALRPHVHKQPEKTTRVRTVLNEKQLHTLRTCYAANPRPDALIFETSGRISWPPTQRTDLAVNSH